MVFNPQFQRTQTEREDDKWSGVRIHNESNKLPGHKERMQAHCDRVQREYFGTNTHLGEVND